VLRHHRSFGFLQALISSAFADSFDHEWMVRNWTDLNIDFFKNLPAIAGVLLPCAGLYVCNHVPFFERITDSVMSNTMQKHGGQMPAFFNTCYHNIRIILTLSFTSGPNCRRHTKVIFVAH
jgi:hypothetical protein